MQIVAALSTYVAFMINLGQEMDSKLIIKSYVALGILGNVDNMFVACLPEEVKANGRLINRSRLLILE